MSDVDSPSNASNASNASNDSDTFSSRTERVYTDKYRITLSASRLAAWLGYEDQSSWNRGKSRAELFELWHAPRPTAPAGTPNPRCSHGISMEKHALAAYRKLMGLKDEGDMWQCTAFAKHREYPWLGAAPDAMARNTTNQHPDEGEFVLVEVKCPSSLVTDPDKCVVPERSWLLQIYLQLECFPQAKACDLVVYNGIHLWLWRVRRDELDAHVPYKVETFKRSADGTMKTGYREMPPMRLMDAMLGELAKYTIAAQARAAMVPFDTESLRADREATERIKIEFAQWRKWACFNMAYVVTAADGDGPGSIQWVKTYPGEKRTNPHNYTHIDRFYLGANPPCCNAAFAERFMNVRWLDGDMERFWDYDEATPDAPYPRGGFIRQEYHTVKKPVHGADPVDLTVHDMPMVE